MSSPVAFSLLADGLVVVHLGFVVFVAVGAVLAWRWPRLIWAHLPAVAWGVAIVTIGFDCPLTPLEKHLRRRGGEDGYDGGFIDHYVEDVLYPEEYTPLLRAVMALFIAIGWAGVLRQRGWRRPGPPSGRRDWRERPIRSLDP